MPKLKFRQPIKSTIGSKIAKASLHIPQSNPVLLDEPLLSSLAAFGRPGSRRRYLSLALSPLFRRIEKRNDAIIVCYPSRLLRSAINASSQRLIEDYWRRLDTSDLNEIWRQVSDFNPEGCAPFAMTLLRDAMLFHLSSIISLQTEAINMDLVRLRLQDITSWLFSRTETALIVDHVWRFSSENYGAASNCLLVDPPVVNSVYPQIPLTVELPDVLAALLLRSRIRKRSSAPVQFWEIGTASADTSYALLQRLPWLQLTAVDSYASTVFMSTSVAFSGNETSAGKLSQYLYASNILKNFPDRAKLLRMDSVSAARLDGSAFESPDLVFIDAGHDFCNVLADVQAWWPRMRQSNGILAGHDWSWGLGYDEGPAVAMALFHQLSFEHHTLHVSPAGVWWIDFSEISAHNRAH